MTAQDFNFAYNYANEDREHFRQYCSDMEQLAYARMSTLEEGNGRGSRIIEVNNGSGLCFTVTPDRGMDIVEASFRGIPLAFRTPCGHVGPDRCEQRDYAWLRNWPGGLLTTCGLRHVGQPLENTGDPLDPVRGLHGRISAQSAEDVGISRGWSDGRYEISLSGTLREAMMFGENLRLHRTIRTGLGDNQIHIRDTVTNEGHRAESLNILYHCNFGYPAIAPDSMLLAQEHPMFPRDKPSQEGLGEWRTLPPPQSDIPEQCFLHQIPADKNGWAKMTVVTPRSGIKISVCYATSTLPNLLQWKLPESGRYVLGLEPTNTGFPGQSGKPEQLFAPGAASIFQLCLGFHFAQDGGIR